MSKWEYEFNQLMSAQRDELDHDYGEAMQSAWENGADSLSENTSMENPLKFDFEGLPMLDGYAFGIFFTSSVYRSGVAHTYSPPSETSNKYLDPSLNRSLLKDAKDLLENNGSLSEAALLLEAAIQKGELGEGGCETWILLGETRNMDEREDAGMRALMEGVRRAQEAGTPGPGMLVRCSVFSLFSLEPRNLLFYITNSPWLFLSPTNHTIEHLTPCSFAG